MHNNWVLLIDKLIKASFAFKTVKIFSGYKFLNIHLVSFFHDVLIDIFVTYIISIIVILL